nr:hypothetical protein [Tanacetum cinerariifolium]
MDPVGVINVIITIFADGRQVRTVSLQGTIFYIREPNYGHETLEEERPDQSCINFEATEKKTLLSSYGKATISFTENGKEPASANKFVAPLHATIQITLELFSKKVFNEGEGYDRQIDGAIVQGFLICYSLFVFCRGGNIEKRDRPNQAEFNTKVVDGIDRGVKTMKKGEVASLTIHPEYAFGSTELHQESVTVPANSNVYYAIDLVSFEKRTEVEVSSGDAYEEKEENDATWDIEQERETVVRSIQAWGFVVMDSSSVLFFIDEKPKTAMPRWSKARNRATNVGKGVVTDATRDETVKWDDGLLLRLKPKLGTQLLE